MATVPQCEICLDEAFDPPAAVSNCGHDMATRRPMSVCICGHPEVDHAPAASNSERTFCGNRPQPSYARCPCLQFEATPVNWTLGLTPL